MKNNIGIGGRQRAAESVGIADIADLVIDSIGKLKLVKKCRLCFRRLTETGHFGTEREKPFAEPGTFETGMPGNKNRDRKSTRLNSSQVASSYAVFCLRKK